MDRGFALKVYHWAFLAQPHPLPENLIASNPDDYFGRTYKSWAKKDAPNPFDPRAVEHYLTAFRDPLRIHAACEDYRAGAYADFDQDKADLDAGNKITVPLLALWGGAGIASAASSKAKLTRTLIAFMRPPRRPACGQRAARPNASADSPPVPPRKGTAPCRPPPTWPARKPPAVRAGCSAHGRSGHG